MLTNLKREMNARKCITKDVADLLGISEKSVSNKISEVTDFTYPEAEKLRRIMFPHLTFEYLFASDAEDDGAVN